MSQLVQLRWDTKLTNWALWKVGLSNVTSTCGAPRDWWNCPPRPPQPLVGEALDTDRLLVAMAEEPDHGAPRYEAVVAWYVWSYPETYADRAAVLRIHPDTLTDRVRSARYRLDDLAIVRRGITARSKCPQTRLMSPPEFVF